MLLDELKRRLDVVEEDAVLPLFRIDTRIIDEAASRIELREKDLVCEFRSVDSKRCPFTIIFDRYGDKREVSFFFGLGAELWNLESVDETEARKELAVDVESFLTSRISCERFIGKKGIAREVYRPSKFVLEGEQLLFSYRAYYAFLGIGLSREVFEYSPWLHEPPSSEIS